MNRPVRFADCVDFDGDAQGPAVIDAADVSGVESRRILDRRQPSHVRVLHCTQITFGTDCIIRVREPIEEVLWRLGILA